MRNLIILDTVIGYPVVPEQHLLPLVICESNTLIRDFEMNNSLLWFLATIKRLLDCLGDSLGPCKGLRVH